MKIIAPSKKIKDCFKDFYYRDSDFDAWLPSTQPKKEGEITVIQLESKMTFLEMAQKYLGSTDIEVIKKHTLTLPMVEEMIKNHEDELRTNGWANFFFLESADGGVSVGGVYRDERGWDARVSRLGFGFRCHADARILVCNSDTRANSDTLTLVSLDARVKRLEDIFDRVFKQTEQTINDLKNYDHA